ncbi:MAG: zinc-binding dehydrogenase [Myxococcales bacterium]|nr:zinc-binding dehydrogenase [Myxococcales bacterium]MCB9534429.1 zinc-binding dehydrogenase [Myxococcales bacterium]
MRAQVLVRNGDPKTAFEIRELPDPTPAAGEVCIDVEAFGLNFADVQARLGLYRDAPPLPAVLGYEVVGEITSVGAGVDAGRVGQRVVAFTRFGGYATRVVTPTSAAVPVPAGLDAAEALALPTQMGTAWFCAEDRVRIRPGDNVLVHAAAGGVGTGLVQLCKRRGAVVFGTCGSAAKRDLLVELGVDHPLLYKEQDVEAEVRRVVGDRGLDVVFDSIGGQTTAASYRLLGAGGRLVCFGAAAQSGERKSLFRTVKMALGFPVTHPIPLMLSSRAAIGVNMLRIADDRPEQLGAVLEEVVKLVEAGELKVTVGGRYPVEDLATAHAKLGAGDTVGKVAILW